MDAHVKMIGKTHVPVTRVRNLTQNLALSEQLSLLGFIFRSPTPTFVKIATGPFYQLLHFLIFYYQNFNSHRIDLVLQVDVILQNSRLY